MSNTAKYIEALLFALGRPLEREELAEMLNVSEEDIAHAVKTYEDGGRGIVLVDDGRTIELRTSNEAHELVTQVRRAEYDRDIGRAGLEVLSAILYRGPLTRSEVDFIRGVNSSQTLRTLTMRGLVRKLPNPKDERSFLYEPTTELLSELGVRRPSELPEFSAIREKLESLEAAYRAKEKESDDAN